MTIKENRAKGGEGEAEGIHTRQSLKIKQKLCLGTQDVEGGKAAWLRGGGGVAPFTAELLSQAVGKLLEMA